MHLVVDDAASMGVWARPLAAVTDVLRRANAFAAVENWLLSDTVDHPVLSLRLAGPIPAKPPWLRTGGDNIVLLATDARDNRWRGQEWWDVVWEWARRASVALLNPLPARWWGRTALPQQAVRIRAQTQALSNTTLTARVPRRMRDAASGHATMALPVLGLAAGDLLAWSRTVTDAHPQGCLGVLLVDGHPAIHPQHVEIGAEAVAGFRRLADRSSRKLAVLLSAGEVHTVETMRIVQEELVPGSSAADLAQVLAGGLLHQDRPGVFRFDPAARQELHAELRTEDAYYVHCCLRTALERRTGTNVFRALIDDPAGTELIPAQLQALAAASLSALQASGHARTRPGSVPVPPAGRSVSPGSTEDEVDLRRLEVEVFPQWQDHPLLREKSGLSRAVEHVKSPARKIAYTPRPQLRRSSSWNRQTSRALIGAEALNERASLSRGDRTQDIQSLGRYAGVTNPSTRRNVTDHHLPYSSYRPRVGNPALRPNVGGDVVFPSSGDAR